MNHLLDRYERQADDAYMENLDSQRVSPSNVPYLLTYLQRDEAGHMDPNATLNALCEGIRTAEEDAAEEIRVLMHDMEILSSLRNQFEMENHELRRRLTTAEMLLRASRERWDERSTGVTLLELDLLLGNPEAQMSRAA